MGWPKGKPRGPRTPRPESEEPMAEGPAIALTKDDLIDVLRAVKGDDAEKDSAIVEAIRQSRQPIPENIHPPPSDVPPPKCSKMTLWGHPVGQESKEEMELLNQLEPGRYTITKSNNTKVKVNVKAVHDDQTGELVEFHIQADGVTEGWIHDMMPMPIYLREMLAQKEPVAS